MAPLTIPPRVRITAHAARRMIERHITYDELQAALYHPQVVRRTDPEYEVRWHGDVRIVLGNDGTIVTVARRDVDNAA